MLEVGLLTHAHTHTRAHAHTHAHTQEHTWTDILGEMASVMYMWGDGFRMRPRELRASLRAAESCHGVRAFPPRPPGTLSAASSASS